MAEIGTIADKVRSKNAGPFWLTVDIFCGDLQSYNRICTGLTTSRVAYLFNLEAKDIKRFDIEPLRVVKFSFPRPTVQGGIDDRDMHGASWAALLSELDIN